MSEAESAALLLGLVTGLHCAGMCGPLVCAFCSTAASEQRAAWMPIFVYQVSRWGSYSVVGAILGAIGSTRPERFFPWVSWIMVVALLLIAVGGERWFPSFPGLQKSWSSWVARFQKSSPSWRALGVGGLTPLLPCGPMYLMFVAAAISGSSWTGAKIMSFFVLGTWPAYLLVQLPLWMWPHRWSGNGRLRQGLALVGALVLIWRIASTGTSTSCH